MMFGIIGALAILIGGSAADGARDVAGAIGGFIAAILTIALLYGYWCLGVMFFFWLLPTNWSSLGLFLPIVLPMLIASAIHGIIYYRNTSRVTGLRINVKQSRNKGI